MHILFLILLGIIGGIIAGALGLGGGIFYILIFPYLMSNKGVPAEAIPQFVIANSLFGIMIASGASIIGYKRKGEFPLKEIIAIGIASSIMAYLSINLIVLQPWFSRTIFNIFIITLMLYILLKMYLELHIEKIENGKINTAQGLVSGGIAGFVSALSGLGGGIIVIPILTMRFRVSLVKAKTISLAMIFLSSITMTLNNLLAQPPIPVESIKTIGYIIPSCVIPIAIGVLFGSTIGVKLSVTIRRKYLDISFMIFVLIVLTVKIFDLIQSGL